MDQAGLLEDPLRECKIGQYNRLSKALPGLVKLDVRQCTCEDLEGVHGIGPKTARFFLLYTREDQRMAVLDTHILKWMRKQGWKAPKLTPSGKRYRELEEKFLAHCDEVGKTPRELDDAIWREYRVEITLKERS